MLLGTARYPSLDIMRQAVATSGVKIITVSLKRENNRGNAFWKLIKELNCTVLPNTAGCRTAKEAITHAQMAQEIFKTNLIKLEVIGDDYTLQPDPFGLVQAAKELIDLGFEVLPYSTEDLILCQQLRDCGCKVIMPWASPIGSGQGVLNPSALEMLRHRLQDVTLIIDAGIGKPSDAAKVMEMGFDAVLLNSAVALSYDPIVMAEAFRDAIVAGHKAYAAGIMPKRNIAEPSTPVIDTPFWQQVDT